jgi:ligand-binding sensor domain-containing protein
LLVKSNIELRTKILLTFLIVCHYLSSFAQELPFEHLNEQNGLPQISIRALYQGRLGNIWIGTENGLFRFDGNNFESYFDKNDSNEVSLKVIQIRSNYDFMYALGKNNIWQVGVLSGKEKSFSIPTNRIKNPSKIWPLQKELLIGAENGLWLFNPETESFKQTKISTPVTEICQLKQGKILVSTVEQFYVFYPFTKTLVPLNYRPQSFIRHVCVEDENTISWIEADNYFHKGKISKSYEIESQRMLLLNRNSESSSFIKYNQKYYLGLETGLLSFSENGTQQLLVQTDDDFRSLSQNNVTCLLADVTGNLWVGTKLGGINLHNPFQHKFGMVSPQVSARFSKCKEILSFEELADGRVIFMSSVGGLGIFEPESKKITQWIPNGLNGNCMMAESALRNSFLIGTPDGLFRFQTSNQNFEFISTKSSQKNFESDIKCIIPAEGNTYWMGGDDGLFLFDPALKKTLLYYGIGNSSLGSDRIKCLYKKSQDELYIGTAAGLYILNPSTGKFTLKQLNGKQKQAIVVGIAEDSFHKLWVATSTEGVYVLNKNNTIKHLGKEEGIGSNQVYSIEINTKLNQCWISLNGGLSMIETEKLMITNYELHDGLQGSQYIESSSWQTRNGKLFFGGVNGFNFFYPSEIKNDTNECGVQIKGIALFNKRQQFSNYYLIPIDKNYVAFEFAAMDYYLKGIHTYYYQLEGLQTDWTEIGDRRFASFGQLPQGDYVFRVRVKNPDGKISKKEAAVHFSIVPKFYQQWWFKLLVALALSGTIAFVIYYRIQTALKEEQDKGKQSRMIAELELKALRAQMNPHFIFNSLNSIQDFVLNNEGQLAARYLSKFARLIRMILDISEQTFVNIQLKIDFLKLYIELECLRLNNSFTYHFDIDPDLNLDALLPTLIIQPYVENAIWHGLQYKQGERKLSIKMEMAGEKMIRVEVLDNGIGRKEAMKIKQNKSQLHESKGARISEERINTLNKLFGSKPKVEILDLFDENNLACGTKVVLLIPIIHG